MENVEIPDDFYVVDGFLCHKSCLYVNDTFSNYRHVCIYGGVNYTDIDRLRFICNTYDKIEEITYFIDKKFNNLYIVVFYHTITIYYDNKYHRFASFDKADKALQYLRENHPECIKNDDIKIALKD